MLGTGLDLAANELPAIAGKSGLSTRRLFLDYTVLNSQFTEGREYAEDSSYRCSDGRTDQVTCATTSCARLVSGDARRVGKASCHRLEQDLPRGSEVERLDITTLVRDGCGIERDPDPSNFGSVVGTIFLAIAPISKVGERSSFRTLDHESAQEGSKTIGRQHGSAENRRKAGQGRQANLTERDIGIAPFAKRMFAQSARPD